MVDIGQSQMAFRNKIFAVHWKKTAELTKATATANIDEELHFRIAAFRSDILA
jgi:hypothetical protein